MTTVEATHNGTLALVPGDVPQIKSWTGEMTSGQARATFAVVGLGLDGSAGVRAFPVFDSAAGSVHLIIDVTGTFE